MHTSVCASDHTHQLGEPATRPSAGLPGRLAALLLLAGNDPARRRALPDNPAGPHSDAFNRGIKVETNVLRGMDAIHIGSAVALKADVFISADKRQREAATRAGLRVESV